MKMNLASWALRPRLTVITTYSFRVRILKMRMGRGDHFVNLHPFHPASKLRSIDRISTPEQISRRGVIGDASMICSGGPLGCRIRGHIEMNDLLTVLLPHTPTYPNISVTCVLFYEFFD